MKLIRVHVIAAQSCGGLLDGLDLWLRSSSCDANAFEPVCFVGPNGAGKSQFLQAVAEIFQSLVHATAAQEERTDSNPNLQFEVEYLIKPEGEQQAAHVRASRLAQGRRKPIISIAKKEDGDWVDCEIGMPTTRALLPTKVVGYTSGGNETLSLPFLLSRSGYADDVGGRALDEGTDVAPVPDTGLMLIDYGTHIEVLVSNLLLGSTDQREVLVQDARLNDIHSFRCIIQLAHSAAPKAPAGHKGRSGRRGIQLTAELEEYLDRLRRCSTCYQHEHQTDTYTFDFLVDAQTRSAFGHFWASALELYSAFHKLAMLNDLAIPKGTRERFRKDTRLRRFASRLPEPQDEDKVFRFEQVAFVARGGGDIVDYVSLSDGEHQLAQVLGTMCMVSFPGVLFLLDEPESHFNPQWRVKFLSRVLALPTASGKRGEIGPAAQQDCLLTTHSPFVPSDMPRDRVFIFSKDRETGKIATRNPDIETFGTTFDSILAECFDIRPPISDVPLARIEELKASDDPQRIKEGMDELGDSVEKIMLGDRLRQLKKLAER